MFWLPLSPQLISPQFAEFSPVCQSLLSLPACGHRSGIESMHRTEHSVVPLRYRKVFFPRQNQHRYLMKLIQDKVYFHSKQLHHQITALALVSSFQIDAQPRNLFPYRREDLCGGWKCIDLQSALLCGVKWLWKTLQQRHDGTLRPKKNAKRTTVVSLSDRNPWG